MSNFGIRLIGNGSNRGRLWLREYESRVSIWNLCADWMNFCFSKKWFYDKLKLCIFFCLKLNEIKFLLWFLRQWLLKRNLTRTTNHCRFVSEYSVVCMCVFKWHFIRQLRSPHFYSDCYVFLVCYIRQNLHAEHKYRKLTSENQFYCVK